MFKHVPESDEGEAPRGESFAPQVAGIDFEDMVFAGEIGGHRRVIDPHAIPAKVTSQGQKMTVRTANIEKRAARWTYRAATQE